MKKIDKVYFTLKEIEEDKKAGVTALDICDFLNDDRPNISRLLNQLHKQNKVSKFGTRPVYYNTIEFSIDDDSNILNYISFNQLLGRNYSLKKAIQQSKALLQYPPHGLNTLIIGERGTGKKDFSKAMYRFSRELGSFDESSRYLHINCLEYQNHLEDLLKLLKATEEKNGKLTKKPDRFIYLSHLDQLAPEIQDKVLIELFVEDISQGELNKTIVVIGITDTSSTLIDKYKQYIQHSIDIPNLDSWSLDERLSLIGASLGKEASRLKMPLFVEKRVLQSLLLYKAQGNITQLEADIQWIVANAYLDYTSEHKEYLLVKYRHLAKHVAMGIFKLEENPIELEALLASKGDIIQFNPDSLELELEINPYLDTVANGNKSNKDNNKKIINLEIKKTLIEDLEIFLRQFENLQEKNKVEEESKILKDLLKILDKDSEYSQYTKGIQRSKLIKSLDAMIHRSINNIVISYTKKSFIKLNYEDSYNKALSLSKLIENKFSLTITPDEVAILALFFIGEDFDSTKSNKVKVIVLCHGKGIASGIANFVNGRYGGELVLAFDMDDYQNLQSMYETLKYQIDIFHEGEGILLMVDMGQLNTLEKLLKSEINIELETIKNVSLPLVIKAVEMSEEGYKLTTIARECNGVI